MYYKLFFIILFLFIISLSIFKLLKLEQKKNEIIKVQISLINNCELYDKVFMVKASPSGKTTKFIDKRAIMYLKRASKVKLVVSDEFPGFHFSSLPVDVSYNTKLVADCSNSDRLDNIFDSLQKQFNKNSN
ncbi:MAG: hypothetical protein CMJ06_04265 [Pelagibacterales bacterium]|nr:hypothetical protein [Pelagibacterales bacterium]OUU61927.1 MAG: hypothetical protein CBC22_05715 [Alphaproteobacteria bacterium TMED62]|tara:strand:- start:1018 stop:1410 length:393 start_codon:yes stop_codon:yes gene_type:complete